MSGKGCVSVPVRRDFDQEGRGWYYSGLQRVVAVVRVRWHCNAAGGFVRGLPAEPLDTSRRNKVQKEPGGGEGNAGRESVAKRRKKNNIAESGRKRQKRGGRARAGKKRGELK